MTKVSNLEKKMKTKEWMIEMYNHGWVVYTNWKMKKLPLEGTDAPRYLCWRLVHCP